MRFVDEQEWLPIPIEGMVGDPETVAPQGAPVQLLENAELGVGRLRPRPGDTPDLKQPTRASEQVYGVYWIPYPIEYPLIQAWVDVPLGEYGVLYAPCQSAGYFLLRRNRWLAVRFLGFLKTPLTTSSRDVEIVGEDPTEFYEWMRKGYLQISQKVGDEYRSEIVEYEEGRVDFERQFRATVWSRGQRGTTAKAWTPDTTNPVRLFGVYPLEAIPAPEILSVTDSQERYARYRAGQPPLSQRVAEGANLNEWFDAPVIAAPTMKPVRGSFHLYTSHYASEGIGFYERMRLGNTLQNPNRYAYGPRPNLFEDSFYYQAGSDTQLTGSALETAKRTNWLGNNWDAYLLSGDAYWRSLPNYLTGAYDSIAPEFLGTGEDGPVPHVDFKTLGAARYYLCMRVMLNGETEHVRFLYRFLRNPLASARDRSQYVELDWRGLSVIEFDEVRIWGAPVALQEQPSIALRIGIHNRLPPAGDPLYAVMPQHSSAAPAGWRGATPAPAPARTNHSVPDPTLVPVEWESAEFIQHQRMWGEIGTPTRPFLEVVLRKVRAILTDIERDAVWGIEFQPYLLGTGRTPGSSQWIAHVWGRGYRHGGVLTHAGIAIGFPAKENESFYRVRATGLQGDTREVILLSPSYAGRVRGRVRIYTAVLWQGGSPSAAATPYTASFARGYASPLVRVGLPEGSRVGDTLVLYVYSGKSARAVAAHTLTAADLASGEVLLSDSDETLAYPFVDVGAPYPYGPVVSAMNRLIVLDGAIWVSSQSDYPTFGVYPTQPTSGFRILVSDPIERVLLLDGQPVVIGPRSSYRIVFSESGGGEAVPYPVALTSDMSGRPKGRLEDHDAFVTREGLVGERGIVYKLPEDWMSHPSLRSVWVVRTPYGAALVRHYGERIVITHPCLTVRGYQWTTIERAGGLPDLRDVQWVGGLVLMFTGAIDSAGRQALRVRSAPVRVSEARYRISALYHPLGLRARQIELAGHITENAPVQVRLLGSDGSVVSSIQATRPYRPYTFRVQGKKLDAPSIEFVISRDAIWDGAMLRTAPGGMA